MQSAPLWLRKPTLPGLRHGGGEGGVQAGQRAHHAQAVRADDPHPAAPRLLQDLPLQLRALGPDLLEAGRDDDRRREPRPRRTRRSRPGTVGAGVTMTARSTGSGTAAMLG